MIKGSNTNKRDTIQMRIEQRKNRRLMEEQALQEAMEKELKGKMGKHTKYKPMSTRQELNFENMFGGNSIKKNKSKR
jgi:hypothetical protein